MLKLLERYGTCCVCSTYYRILVLDVMLDNLWHALGSLECFGETV